jgi:putative membrane protein (TIGR04086 family)
MLFPGGEFMKYRPLNNQALHPLRGGAWLILLKGILLALVFSLVMLLVISLILYLTALTERAALYLVYGVSIVSILWGAAYATRRIGTRGWLNGGIIGVAYVLLMIGGGLIIVDDMTVGWSLAVKIFLGFVFGAIGGMWGVNY